jgi:monoamine oxidase
VLTALLAQGELVRDGVIRDMSIERALRGYQYLPYFDVAVDLLLVQDGADPAVASLLDYYNFAAHSPAPFVYPPNDTHFLPYGMGNLMTRLSEGLPVTLNAPVETISYGSTPITVGVAGGRTFKARKLIITASTGVLASNAIVFDPPLPQRHREAIVALPMGGAYKAALTFKTNIFAGHAGVHGRQMTSLIDLTNHPSLSVFVNDFSQPMAVFVADGTLGDQYESMSDAEASKFFLRILEKYFPGATAEWTGKIRTTGWRNNRYTKGATSYATVGQTQARTRLATPISRKIWFAGEALSVSAHSQIQGAWLSGESAAFGALSALGAAVPERSAG